jgi:plasmid stabilization system protein ParE
MVKRNIIWTRTADIQFVGILEYWVKRNKSNRYSVKLIKLVSERTRQIAKNPELYKRTDFKNIRIASLGNYSIYFKTTKKEIIISAFWDNRQDPKKLLKTLTGK